MSASKSIKYFGEIINSPSDSRKYRALVIENGMKILLAHEPNLDKSAASVSVAIGSMNDPPELQGLAHLLEHMLFFETLEPSAESRSSDQKKTLMRYSKFIAENGGSCNAYTVRDQTNYHFDVASSAFEEALTRFSKFFTEPPAFPASALEKEVSIVNSEHENNITNDAWRKMGIEACTSKKGHPFQQFTTGNRETLWTTPKNKSMKVEKQLKTFHEKYYSANIMSLILVGKESLDQLEDMIVPLFSKVVNRKTEMPKWINDKPYGPEECGVQIEIVPLADVRDLYICFPIPDIRPYYKTSPHGYLTSLLGHKGSGSLFSLLYLRNWINNSYVSTSVPVRGFGYLSIGLLLTIEGLGHIDEIIGYVFQYIKMLKEAGPQRYFWEELKKILEIQFKFQEKDNSVNFVQRFAYLMHVYPLERVLSIGYILSKFDAELITEFLNCLTPQNSRILRVTKANRNTENLLTEKWYGVQYSVSKISLENLTTWADPIISNELHLPVKNEFIPSNFALKFGDGSDSDNQGKPSTKNILNSDLNTVWFFNRDDLLIPKGFVRVELFSPKPMSDPVSFNLIHIMCMVMKDLLIEQFYGARLTGMNYMIKGTMYGVEITVDGFDEKIITLMEEIIRNFVSFTPIPNRFKAVKDAYENGLENRKSQQPHLQVPYYLGLLLREKRFTNEELLESSKCIKLDMIEKYKQEFLDNLKLEWFFYGNLLETDALQLVENIRSVLDKRGTLALPQSQTARLREISLTEGSTSVYETFHDHRSSCCAIFLQIGARNLVHNILLELLDQAIYEPCFNQLRNKENLGYVVKTSVRKSNGTQGLLVVVQGNNNHPSVVETRIISFFRQFNEILANMEEEEFEKHKNSVVLRKQDVPKKIWARANRIWNNEIYTREYDFNRIFSEVDHIRSITKSQFQSFVLNYTDPTRKHWKCITLYLNSADAQKEIPRQSPVEVSPEIKPNGRTLISNILNWKTQMGLYPLLINPTTI